MAETALAVRRPTLLRRVARLGHAVREAFSLRDPASARRWAGGEGGTSAGLTVTEDSALNIAAFFQGVGLISAHIAGMPLDHFKRDKTVGKTEMRGSKLNKLFNQQPNPEMSPFSFKEALQAHLLTWGNAYAEIEWNQLDDPIGLWPITPDRVTVYRDVATQGIRYRIASNGPTRSVDAENILHVPGLGFDGLIGYSVIARARQSLGLTAAGERYGATFFGNGGSFGGTLTSPDDLDDEQKKELRAEIERMHQGPDRAHRFLILSNGLKYERMAIPPDDAQFLATRTFQLQEIARWLNLPPHKLKDLERSTFSNIEQMGLEYYTDTLWPWLERWEDQIRRKLIPQAEWNQQFVKFNFNAVLRGDLKSRYDAYAVGRQAGFLCIDEIREKEDLDPLPNGAGKIFLAPLNMVPADQFKAYIEKKLNPPASPAPAPGAPAPQPAPGPTDAELEAAQSRADRADAAAVEARAQAQLAIASVQALLVEARAHSGEQIGIAQNHAAEATARAESIQLLAAEARREVEQLTAAIAVERAARAEQTQIAERAQAAAVEAINARATAETQATRDRESLEGTLTEHRAHLDELRLSLEVAQQEIGRLQRDLQATVAAERVASSECRVLEQARDAARTAATEAEAACHAAVEAGASAQARVTTLEAEVARLDTIRTATPPTDVTDADRARLAAEQQATVDELTNAREQVMDLQASLTARQTAQSETEARLAAANAAHAASLELVEEARAARLLAENAERTARLQQGDLQAALDTAQALTVQRETELRAIETQATERQGAVLLAHRALLVDIMRRMVEREIERAHRAQGSPEKMRRWIGTFYESHEELCVSALLPAIRVHLAWSRSPEDPDRLTRTLVRQYVQDSIRQLGTVIDDDHDALAPALQTVLTRWRAERPEALADAIVQRTLDRVTDPPADPATPVPPTRVKQTVRRDAAGRVVEIVEESEAAPGAISTRVRKTVTRGEDGRITGIVSDRES